MLTWQQKKVYIFLFSIIGSFQNPEFWRPINITNSQRERILKIADELTDITREMSLTNDVFDILIKDIKKGIYKVECFHDSEIKEREKKYKKQTITVKREDFDFILENVMMQCIDCSRNSKRCQIRKSLLKMGIELLDPEKSEGCEFRFKKNGGITNETH